MIPNREKTRIFIFGDQFVNKTEKCMHKIEWVCYNCYSGVNHEAIFLVLPH